MTAELRVKHRLMSFKRTVFVEIYARPTFDDRRATNTAANIVYKRVLPSDSIRFDSISLVSIFDWGRERGMEEGLFTCPAVHCPLEWRDSVSLSRKAMGRAAIRPRRLPRRSRPHLPPPWPPLRNLSR